MPLTEQQAQQITLMRVLEQMQNNGGLWSVDDAKEATRSTIELLGPKAPFAEFVARRAQWSLEKINKRTPDRAILLCEPRWPLIAAQLLAFLALVSGFMSDLVATNLLHPGQINVVELPLMLLIVWNLAFMAWFLVKWVWHLFVRDKQPPDLSLTRSAHGALPNRSGSVGNGEHHGLIHTNTLGASCVSPSTRPV